MKKTLLIDSDGVLVDFYKAWKEMFGHDIQDKPGTSKDRNRNWHAFVDAGGFSKLEMMPNAATLILLLNMTSSMKRNVEIIILSSSGRPDTHDKVVEQKNANWNSIGIKWERIVVPGKRHKKDYANANSFLIDDHPLNIAEFISAGGHGHLYDDAKIGELLIPLFAFLKD